VLFALPQLAGVWWLFMITKNVAGLAVKPDWLQEGMAGGFKGEDYYDYFFVVDRNGETVDEDFLNEEVAYTCLLGLVGGVFVLVETLGGGHGPLAAGSNGLTALLLPFLLHVQTWLFKDYIWSGGFDTGFWWLKFDTVAQLIVLRFLLVLGLSLAFAYLAKKCMELVTSSTLRYALPLFFISYWGTLGRVMQTAMPSLWITLVVEVVLVAQELVQVWAYLHAMGPTKYLLLLVTRRGIPDDDAYGEAVYRTSADLPPKLYAYGYLIIVHAICEAIMVLVGGLGPLLLNISLSAPDCGDVESSVNQTAGISVATMCNAYTEPFKQGLAIGNTLISFVAETFVADGLFCLMAVRKQRRAHTFLATWRLRTSGSILVFVALSALACFPIYAQIMQQTDVVLDGNMFGLRYFPSALPCLDSLKALGCLDRFGFVTDSCPIGNLGGSIEVPPKDIASSPYSSVSTAVRLDENACNVGKFAELYYGG